MSFSFLLPFNDISRVRITVGDTEATAHRFSDELITALITEYGTWQKASIACIDAIINDLLSVPDFTADWLKVEGSKALGYYEKLRARKLVEFGLPGGVGASQNTLTGKVVSVERGDRDETTIV
jgi:hypothetical protein